MTSHTLLVALWVASSVLIPTRASADMAEPFPEGSIQLPQQELHPLIEADDLRAKNGQAIHYGIPFPQQGIRLEQGQSSGARWVQQADGDWLWQVRIEAPGASSLDVGLTRFWLPRGAELTFRDDHNRTLRGPYTDQHNSPEGQLWTPVVPGDVAWLELRVPDTVRHAVTLELGQVNYGYRLYNEHVISGMKSANCNIDVACSEADPYMDQVNSVARILVSSIGALCTGSMINNTAEDGTPYFLTANHCGITTGNAASINFIFNYQSASCRTPGSASSGTPLFSGNFNDTLSGATLVASNSNNDVALIRLNQTPPESYGVFYAGWDRSSTPASSAYSIHHPSGDEKRITFENDPLLIGQASPLGGFLTPGTYWSISRWDLGITEGGSSGGPLFNQDNLITGQLAGGAFFNCPGAEEGDDWYGRFDQSWDFGNSPATRLSDWLDPIGADPDSLQGRGGCVAPTVTINEISGSSAAGDRFVFSASITGQGPYTYAWDLDDNGLIDSTQETAVARYSTATNTTVSLTVTDSANCSSTAQLGLVVGGSQISVVGSNGQVITPSDPLELCGDGDAEIEPNETWSFPFTVINNGTAPITGGYGAVQIDPLSPTNNANDDIAQQFTALESGVVEVGDLGVDESTEVRVTAHIGSKFSCGGDLIIDYRGTGFATGFDTTQSDDFLVVPVGTGNCDSFNTSCPLETFAPIDFQPQRGFWYNLSRSGNGEEIHVVNQQLYSTWYTADEERLPVWYYQQSLDAEPYRYNQVNFDLLRFGLQGDITTTPPQFEAIGDARYAFINETLVLKTWDIRGEQHGELLTFFDLGGEVDGDITDQLFNPMESGWGIGYQRQGVNDFIALYFYSESGNPTWMVNLTADQLQSTGTDQVIQLDTHCPGCVWTEPDAIRQAGPVTFRPRSGGGFDFDSSISIDGAVPVEWDRDNLPLQQISPND